MTEASPRDQMIRTAGKLFQLGGYRATSWRKLIEASGAPWGSAHHYFPGGKMQLAGAAVEAAARDVAGLIVHAFSEGRSAADGVRRLFALSGAMLEASGFRAGCPVTTVALETVPDTEVVAEACRAAFDLWLDTLAVELEGAGLPKARAQALAVPILGMFEGALILARVQRSQAPMAATAEAASQILQAPLDAPESA